jgi:hypothetical protein
MNKKIIIVAAMAIVLAVGITSYFRGTRKEPNSSGAQIVTAICSQSIDRIQEMSLYQIQKKAATWTPQVSLYLQQYYGPIKQVEQVSSDTKVTRGPLGEVKDTLWRVTAEKGSFDMQTSEPTSTHKFCWVAFRFSPSGQWVSVNEWQNTSN